MDLGVTFNAIIILVAASVALVALCTTRYGRLIANGYVMVLAMRQLVLSGDVSGASEMARYGGIIFPLAFAIGVLTALVSRTLARHPRAELLFVGQQRWVVVLGLIYAVTVVAYLTHLNILFTAESSLRDSATRDDLLLALAVLGCAVLGALLLPLADGVRRHSRLDAHQ